MTNRFSDLAKRLTDNCDDLAILENLMDDFDKLSNEDKWNVVTQLLGNLSRARQIAGYGPKATGDK